MARSDVQSWPISSRLRQQCTFGREPQRFCPAGRHRDDLGQAGTGKIDGGADAPSIQPRTRTWRPSRAWDRRRAPSKPRSALRRDRKRPSPVAIEIEMDEAANQDHARDPAFDDLERGAVAGQLGGSRRPAGHGRQRATIGRDGSRGAACSAARSSPAQTRLLALHKRGQGLARACDPAPSAVRKPSIR